MKELKKKCANYENEISLSKFLEYHLKDTSLDEKRIVLSK